MYKAKAGVASCNSRFLRIFAFFHKRKMQLFLIFFTKHLAVNRKIAIFASLNNAYGNKNMKYTELHRRFRKAGYKYDHAEGSHYFYVKNGILTEPIPYHGAKEIPQPLANHLIRRYGV